MSSGHSGTPLLQKLGIRRDKALVFLNAPADYADVLGELPDGATVSRELKNDVDFIQFFATERASLEREFPRMKAALEQDGMIWVSWPKKSSGLRTDLRDSVVREIGLKNGLVDVKICSVDKSWSAMKFVRRLKDRRGSLRTRGGKAP